VIKLAKAVGKSLPTSMRDVTYSGVTRDWACVRVAVIDRRLISSLAQSRLALVEVTPSVGGWLLLTVCNDSMLPLLEGRQ
jgi:hypothetical protein